MILRLSAFMLAATLLAACETPTSSTTASTLEGLPLTDQARSGLSEGLTNLNRADVRSACSAQDIEIARVGALLVAVALSAQQTEPWTASERARVDELSDRFEALGGDLEAVSQPCQDVLEAL